MRRLAALVPAVCLLAACNSGTPSGSSSPSPTAVALTVAQVDAALLTASDLGTGWKGSPPEDAGDGESESPSPSASGGCDFESIREEGVLLDRSVELEKEADGSFLTHELTTFEPGDAAATFDVARELFNRCPSFTSEEEGQTLTLALAELPGVPQLGDGSIGKKVTADVGGQKVTGAFVVFRKGDVIAALFGLSTSVAPEQYLFAAARKAEAKLRA